MQVGNRINIFAFVLIFSLLTACIALDNRVNQEQVDEADSTPQVNGASLPATPTPFLPEPTSSPIVNDDIAIRGALAADFGVSQAELQVSLAENTGLHAKGQVGDEYFLAFKQNSTWIIVYVGLANPPCLDIIQLNFPVEMVPECVDEENNQVIRIAQLEAAIRIALAERLDVGTEEMEIRITDSSGEYLSGRVNNGYFYAVNRNDTWLIVHDGPAAPPCKDIEAYQFPVEMVPQCLDKNNKLVTR